MTTLTVVCDLAICPISHDFVVWLVRAMLEQQKAGAERLHVVLLPHEAGLGGFSRHWGEHGEAESRWRLWHIVMACIPLARATVAIAPKRDGLWGKPVWFPREAVHHVGGLVDAARRGERIPVLRATERARHYVESWIGADRVATITLRQSARDPGRNSNVKAWSAFALELTAAGYRAITLADSEVELARGEGFATLDPDLRLALYERAEINFIGHNGPMMFCWFSSAPYIQFGAGLPEKIWGKHWARYVKLAPGEQLPWARPGQRMVWEADDLPAIRRHFAAWQEARCATTS